MPLCQGKPDSASVDNEADPKQHNNILNEMVHYLHNASNDKDTNGITKNVKVINDTLSNHTSSSGPGVPQGTEALNEMQMIKVIVLVVVVGILLASTCKVIFRTSSRYQTKRSEMDE